MPWRAEWGKPTSSTGIGLGHVSVSQLYDVLVLHPLLEDDLRPDSRLGKDFQQYGMLDPPVDDVGFSHSPLQGIDGRVKVAKVLP